MRRKLATLTRRSCLCWCLPEKVSVEATVMMNLFVGMDDRHPPGWSGGKDDLEGFVNLGLYRL